MSSTIPKNSFELSVRLPRERLSASAPTQSCQSRFCHNAKRFGLGAYHKDRNRESIHIRRDVQTRKESYGSSVPCGSIATSSR